MYGSNPKTCRPITHSPTSAWQLATVSGPRYEGIFDAITPLCRASFCPCAQFSFLGTARAGVCLYELLEHLFVLPLRWRL